MDKFLFSFMFVAFFATFTLFHVHSVMITTSSFECEPNKTVCLENQCYTTPVRKRLVLLNFHCYFGEPLSDVWVYLRTFRKQGNGFKQWMVNFSENICRVIEKTSHSQIFRKIFPGLRKFAKFSTTCPIMGNATILNYPVDYSFIPAIIPEGEYLVIVNVRNNAINASIVDIKFVFVVEHRRKTY